MQLSIRGIECIYTFLRALEHLRYRMYAYTHTHTHALLKYEGFVIEKLFKKLNREGEYFRGVPASPWDIQNIGFTYVNIRSLMSGIYKT